MPRILTEYNLLFSCPGDAYAECYVVINAAVDDFNKYSKSSLSIGVNLTHWSTDSYPQSGGHPQALLNTQIVDLADAAIAVFWTRFGTPTDDYGSGTEEEIERFLNCAKQVFLYFLDKPIPPSMTDSDMYQMQRKQIAAFRKKYENKGIYWVVADEAALKEQFSQHLFLYFAKQVAQETGSAAGNEKSALKLTAIDGSAKAHIQHLTLSMKMGMDARKRSILEKIAVAQNITLPQKANSKEDGSSSENSIWAAPYLKLAASLTKSKIFANSLLSMKDAAISADDRTLIMMFCDTNEITINDEFWHLGGLQIEISQVHNIMGGGHSKSLVGTDEEKRKYELINAIINDIYQYTDSNEYYCKMDEMPYIELVVRNEGTTYDEDIEVSLTVPNDSVQIAEDLPVPLFEIDEIVDEDKLNDWICPLATASIREFDFALPYDANFAPHITAIDMPFQQRDYEAEYERKKEEYYDKIKGLFDWEVFPQVDSDIIKLQIRKLNQFRAMHFPARIFFKSIPDRIQFSITAKYTLSVITGEITIQP